MLRQPAEKVKQFLLRTSYIAINLSTSCGFAIAIAHQAAALAAASIVTIASRHTAAEELAASKIFDCR
jgi:hypothetical protein